ncbi:MAG: hypothetical protein HOH77_19070 [Candidatus Latescibacteria bacterium]|nr:hypothetical protein [Candidatus Latescibacterota bacterium]
MVELWQMKENYGTPWMPRYFTEIEVWVLTQRSLLGKKMPGLRLGRSGIWF